MELSDSANDIKESDIIFDCPHCGKSLAIDYRGAGLTIDCSDCGNAVEVPIPEGMEIADVDSTPEDQEVRILHLRRSLQNAQERISGLEESVEDLLQRRDALEREQRDWRQRQVGLRDGIFEVEASLQTLTDSVRALFALIQREK